MNPSQIRNVGSTPLIVAIGGVDPGAGAGLGRDLLTAHALGAQVRMVGTAWTEQTTDGVRSVEARAPKQLEDAVRCALRSPQPGAVKIGMVPDPASAEAILRGLEGYAGAVVADPVLRASRGGGPLWAGPPGALLALLRRATVATPNIPEAEALTGLAIGTIDDVGAAAAALRAAGVPAVLVKGGHLTGGGDLVTDLLLTSAGERRYARPRVPGPSPRGTGCALATALAVQMASGRPLDEAVARATEWLAERIAAAVDVGDERHLSR
jgi:hydroxymethylpyrimidine/phosphomethylpyrimidine kinase